MVPGILLVSHRSELVDSIAHGIGQWSVASTLRVVATVAQARINLADDPPAILMIDVDLPDDGGFDLLATTGGNVSTIVLASLGAEHKAVAAINAGAHDYLIVDPDAHFVALLPVVLLRAYQRASADNPQRHQRDAGPYADSWQHETPDIRSLQDLLLSPSAIMARSKDLIAIGRADGTISYINESGAAMLGLATPGEIELYRIADVHSEVDARRVLDEYIPAAARHGQWRGENRIKAVDGRLIDVDQVIFPLPDTSGAVQGFATIMVDITEKKAAFEAIRASEERYRTVVESSDNGIAVVDGTGTFLFGNANACRLAGHTPESIVGTSVRDLLEPDIAERVCAAIDTVMRSGKALVFEDHAALQGLDLTFRTTIQPLRNALGEVDAVLLNGVDITQLRQSQEALRRSEEMFRLALSNSNIAVGMVDNDLRFTWSFNPAFASESSRGLGRRIDEVMGSDAAGLFIEALENAISTGRAQRFDVKHCWAENERTYAVHMHPMRADDGGGSGAVILAYDITERVQAEAALRASERRYRQLFEHHGLPNLIMDPVDGRILDASPAASDFYGYSLAELRTLTITEISLTPREIILRNLTSIVEHEAGSFECMHRLADGSVRYVEVFLVAVEFDGHSRLHAVVTDVTERQEALEMLENTARVLEQRVVTRTAELQTITEQLQAIFHGSADGILLVDQALNIRRANRAFEQQVGSPFSELDETNLCTYLAVADGAEDSVQLFTELSHTHGQPHHVLLQRADGTTLDMEITVAPVGAESGDLVCIMRDITERKAAEQKLAEERNLLRAVIDTNPDYLFVKDLEHRHVLVNAAYLDLWGESDHRAILGKTLEERIDSDLYAMVCREDEQVCATGERLVDISHAIYPHAPHLRGSEPTVEPADGLRWGLTTKTPLVNLAGDIIGLIGVTRDVTALKTSEVKERRDSQRYLATINAMSEGLIVRDMGGKVVLCNRASEAILGLTHHQVLGHADLPSEWRTVYADLSPCPPEMYPAMEVLRSRAPQRDVVLGVYKSDDQLAWILVNSELIGADSDEPSGVVSTFIDITAQRQQQEALRASERRLELALRAGGIGVWEWDMVHDFEVWDERTRELHGSTESEADRYIHPDDLPRLLEEIKLVIQNGTTWDTQYRVLRPDGTIRHIHSYAVLSTDGADKQQRMIGVVVDMTEEKEAAAALEEALLRETELGELKSRFVSMASHEFRTPLAAILATTETLSIYRERMDRVQIDARLEKIRRQVSYMKDIIEDVLTLERIQAGRSGFDPRHGWLHVLCSEIVEEFSTREQYRDRIVYRCDTPAVLTTFDDRLMRQVVSNLLSNGLKYSEASTKVYIELVHEETLVRLSVQDSGIGIPEDELDLVFEPFHRATNVGAVSGTGLGLAVVRRAMTLHGGEIHIASEPGQGTKTTVVFSTPLRER